jgi:PEP-CTERM motif
MKAKFASIASALALCAALPATAAPTCDNTFSLGTLSVNDSADYWRAFFSPQTFHDCFAFTLESLSNTSVISTTWDLSFKLNINLDALSLSGGGLAGDQALAPNDIDGYTFTGLQSGNYTLAVGGSVTSNGSDWPSWGVGYGVGVATRSPTVTPVPEPQTLAMLALGLAVVGWGARRKA